MSATNTVSLLGRITKDPVVRTVQSDGKEMTIAQFTIAVDRSRKNSGADFPSCTAFGKNAEVIEKWFHKGMPIGIRGHIQTRNYTNREGQKVYTTEVVVDELAFVPTVREASQDQAPAYDQTQDNAPAQQTAPQQATPSSGFTADTSFLDTEVPFS